ncbi:histidine kinase, partial [Streptomyces sp. SID4956]|nr:histidine kinase [Streptomyces sp. SID4956]
PEAPAGPARRPATTGGGPDDSSPVTDDTDTGTPQPDSAPLPRRVRQASLAPQLKREAATRKTDRARPVERDADEVRSRMASLQRGWQRGREENAAGDDAGSGTAPRRRTKGDGR